MSATMVAALSCSICRKVQHTRAVTDVVQGREWGTNWLNTVTYLDPTSGEVHDACGACAEALDFTGITLLSARDEIRKRFILGPRVVLFLDDLGRLALRYLDDVPELGTAAGSELLAHVFQPSTPVPVPKGRPYPDPLKRDRSDCRGDAECPSPIHWHGCYADLDGSACEAPGDHPSDAPS